MLGGWWLTASIHKGGGLAGDQMARTRPCMVLCLWRSGSPEACVLACTGYQTGC